MKAGEIEEFEDMLEQAEANANNEWELEFTSSIREKFNKYKGDMFVSEKQLEHLEKIARYY